MGIRAVAEEASGQNLLLSGQRPKTREIPIVLRFRSQRLFYSEPWSESLGCWGTWLPPPSPHPPTQTAEGISHAASTTSPHTPTTSPPNPPLCHPTKLQVEAQGWTSGV